MCKVRLRCSAPPHPHTPREAVVLFTGNAASISLTPFDRWGNRGTALKGSAVQRQKQD